MHQVLAERIGETLSDRSTAILSSPRMVGNSKAGQAFGVRAGLGVVR